MHADFVWLLLKQNRPRTNVLRSFSGLWTFEYDIPHNIKGNLGSPSCGQWFLLLSKLQIIQRK